MSNRVLSAACLRAGLLLAVCAAGPVLAQTAAVSGQIAASQLRGGAPADTCSEGFEDIPSLYANDGWIRINTSVGAATPASPYPTFWEAPAGDQLPDGWAYDFGAYSGSPKSRVLAAGNGLAGIGEIANAWLLTPEIEFQPGATLSFWSRAIGDVFFGGFVERMYVRVCTGEDCASNVGSGPDDFGNYTTVLGAINGPGEAWNAYCDLTDPFACVGYPTNWRRFTVTLPESGRGRVAFHYHTPGVGMLFGEGVQIGVDSVQIDGVARCPLRHDRLFDTGFERVAGAGEITQNLDNGFVDAALDVWTCWRNDANGTDFRNTWLRRFDLHAENGLSGRVAIDSVDVGVQFAGGSQYVPVRLYALAADAELTYANLSLIGQAELAVDGSDEAVIRNLPLTAVLADAEQQHLVVEIAPAYGATYREFFPGLNRAGQTAPTYYSGACSTATGPVGTGIIDMTALRSAGDDTPLYGPDDALVVTVHAAQRPAGAENDGAVAD